MDDVEKTLKGLMDTLLSLSEKEVLSYWIFGEYEEEKIHKELAEKAEELRLPPSLVSTFRKLSKEDREHGDSLWRLYVKTYGEEPRKVVDLPFIEAVSLARALEDPSNVEFVFRVAMETELLAKKLYEHLASITENGEAKGLYEFLADFEWVHYQRLRGEAELMGMDVGKIEEEIRKKGFL
ncbi:ferritin-like domain-containing protein [Thermococcus waiotapuensis]|uniref:Ferritin family protein n=1 Tax=Thermococcus waiotapuensis TaxID=90909 RepID=A0AAE4T3H7_9EURY|nr:ferritin family protein [Thermococcus waiotapuensis]MDV3103808.1 ferritin family protein [Thermococcus waiotapuensis]